MIDITFKSTWIQQYERERDFFDEKVDPFENWKNRTRHGSIAEDHLINALSVLYGSASEAVVRNFLLAATGVVDRAEAEGRFEHDVYSRGSFPRNRGVALRARAYALALLRDTLPTHDLLQASVDFQAWCNLCALSEWDSQAQADWLSAVRSTLVLSDLDRFASLMIDKRPFSWHEEEHAIYKAISVAFRQSSVVILDRSLAGRFRDLFDRIRDPEFKPDVFLETDIVRFELGAIWCKYFAPQGEFRWRKVIDSVSA